MPVSDMNKNVRFLGGGVLLWAVVKSYYHPAIIVESRIAL